MQITIYKNFSKRRNSTKQPTGGTPVNVELIEPCDVEAPMFILNGIDTSINYVKAFGEYYYVTEKHILDGVRMQIVCEMDSLATAKSDIKSGSAFVLYSSSQYNAFVTDNRVAVEGVASLTSETESGANVYSATPYFVLSVVAGSGHTGEFCNNYVLTPSQLSSVADKFYDTTIQNALNTLFAGDPLKGAVSLTMVPIPIAYASDVGTSAHVYVANNDTGVSGILLGHSKCVNIATVAGFAININDYTDLEPYAHYSLNLPYVGIVNLPMQDIASNLVNLTIDARIDLQSGSILYLLKKGSNIFAQYSASCGINMPLSSNHTNLQGVITNTLSTVTSAASGNMSGMFLSAIGAAQSLMTPVIGQKGVQGGFAPLLPPTDFILCKRKHIVPDYDSNAYLSFKGMPLGEVISLSGLSGYVQTQGASISTHLTPSKTDSINAMLDSGIYLE